MAAYLDVLCPWNDNGFFHNADCAFISNVDFGIHEIETLCPVVDCETLHYFVHNILQISGYGIGESSGSNLPILTDSLPELTEGLLEEAFILLVSLNLYEDVLDATFSSSIRYNDKILRIKELRVVSLIVPKDTAFCYLKVTDPPLNSSKPPVDPCYCNVPLSIPLSNLSITLFFRDDPALEGGNSCAVVQLEFLQQLLVEVSIWNYLPNIIVNVLKLFEESPVVVFRCNAPVFGAFFMVACSSSLRCCENSSLAGSDTNCQSGVGSILPLEGITPLFSNMLASAEVEEGEGSEQPLKPQPTPSPTQLKRLGTEEPGSKQGKKNVYSRPRIHLDAFDNLEAGFRHMVWTIWAQGHEDIILADALVMLSDKAKLKGVEINEKKDAERLAISVLTLKPLPKN
ncbi:hypothetical protein Tco_1276061 [Tanacetum coccineum]